MLRHLSSKPVTAVANGLGILTAVFTVLSWLTPDWFGELTLPKAILVGTGMAIVAMLALSTVLALVAWAYRKMRPAGISDDIAMTVTRTAYDDTKLLAEVGKLRTEVIDLTTIKKAIVDDYQRMSGLEVRFTEALDGLKKAIEQKDQTVGANFGALQDRVVALDGTYAGEVAGLKAQMSLTADALHQQFQTIYLAVGAIFHRERLHTLAQSIEAGAQELARPSTEKAILDSDQWEAWQVHELGWMEAVETWSDLAENYVPGIKERVTTTTRADYLQTGQAKVEQFPTPEAYTAYKGFCAIWKNWRNWQLDAIRAVHQAAFNRGGRIPVAGGGDMEELGGPA